MPVKSIFNFIQLSTINKTYYLENLDAHLRNHLEWYNQVKNFSFKEVAYKSY